MKCEMCASAYLPCLFVYECVVSVRSGLRIHFTQKVKLVIGLEELHAKLSF